MILLMYVAFVFVAVVVMTGAARKIALRHELIDVPNERSSHRLPTPRGGGLAIVAGTGLAWMATAFGGYISPGLAVVLLAGGIVVAGVGLIDDRAHVSAGWRVMVHLLAASLVAGWSGGLQYLHLAGQTIELGGAGLVLGVLGIIWMTNLFNFMDGIDGIAGVESATVSFGATGLLWQAGQVDLALLASVVGAASLGFLVWNWPPAKIFLGDVGSSFLGFTLGALALITHANETLDIWVWFILLGVFIVDATTTLLRRVLRRQRFYEAHRAHAYQHAAIRHQSHARVSLVVGALNLLWLLPIAVLVENGRLPGIYAVLIAYLPLIGLAVRYRAGLEDL